MTNRFSAAIIGGGILGLAIAYSLLKQGKQNIILLEKNSAFGLEQSGPSTMMRLPVISELGVYFELGFYISPMSNVNRRIRKDDG